MGAIAWTLNGRPVRILDADPCMTLLEYLRSAGLTGTKEGCAEGECGACAVAWLEWEPGEEGASEASPEARACPSGSAPCPEVVLRPGVAPRYRAVNSCLLPLPAVHGRDVWTVEGLAQGERLHPVQEALVRYGGSQCGYCTPGFVMSMFAEYYRPGRTPFDLETLGGNLCRCTGYRPIRDAARSLGQPQEDDPFLLRLQSFATSPEARRLEPVPGFYRPRSLSQLLTIMAAHPQARLVAGGTDLMVERNLRGVRWPALISLEEVPELKIFHWTEEGVEIGAALSLAVLEERIAGRLPLLEQLLPRFASRLIRNRATLGGNLATASPIGDGAPVLLALDARVRIAGPGGERTLPLASFFTGYRQTALQPGEVLVSIFIPRPFPAYSRFYKVAKREYDDISTVAGAFALDLDSGGRVTRIRLAYGGVAPTPVRAVQAEGTLLGRPWSWESLREAQRVLDGEFQPITDHRGSAAYRKALVRNLLERFYRETEGAMGCAS